jgi:sugar phosphate permease
MMFFGLSLMGLGFFALRWVSSLTMLYVVFLGLLAVGSSFGTGRPLQVAAANWFIRKRGRALGLLMSGYGLGGSLVFLFAMLIEHTGWRFSAVVAGLVMWVVGFPLIIIIRHKPEHLGLLPDGDDPPESSTQAVTSSTPSQEPVSVEPESHTVRFWQRDPRPELDLSAWQAVRTRAFWMMAITYAVFAGVPGITTVHLAPFLAEELNLDYVLAVAALSGFVFASVFGRIGFGIVADYVNVRILVAFLLLMVSATLYLFSTIEALSQVPAYVTLFGLAYGGIIPLRGVLQGYFFGRTSFGTVGGFLQFVDLPATVAAPWFIGFLADEIAGGYRIGFKLIALFVLIAVFAILAAKRPREPLPSDAPPNILKILSGRA